MSVPAGHGAGGDERVEHGLLRGIGHRFEEQVDAILVEDANADQICLLVVREKIGGRESECNVAAAMTPERAEPSKADTGTANGALELSVAQWNIRGRDDDDRAFLGSLLLGLCRGRCDYPAVGQAQIAGTAEVRQDEHTQVVIASVEREAPG